MENRKARAAEDYQAEIRARLNELKARWGLSEIARRTGTPLTNVHRYAHEGKIPAEFLSALVDAFETNPAWLLAGAGGAMLSEVEPGTAKLGGNLLELVEAMNAVSRMRLGALGQKTEDRTLRALGEAMDTYERLREKINAQSRPILRELLGRMRAHQGRMELQRAASIRKAALQVSRFCDADDLLSELDSLLAMFEHLHGRVDAAMEIHFRMFARKLRDGGLKDTLAVEEAGNFALALRDSGRFVDGLRICEAALQLARDDTRQSTSYLELEVIAGSFQFELGDLIAGLARVLRALQRLPETSQGFAAIMRYRAELLGGLTTLTAMRKSPLLSRGGVRVLMRHAGLVEDAPELAELARSHLGGGMVQVPPDEYDSRRTVLLADLLAGRRKGALARAEKLVAESPPRVNSPQLRDVVVAVHRAQVARLAADKRELARCLAEAQRAMDAVPADRTITLDLRALHARNLLAAGTGDTGGALRFLRESADAGYASFRALIPA
ncbi:MAG: hypothetical protein KF754_00430 [Planctomycetes bacterium]|nr:hypothetical protein [Planctomycetota bacterium]